jgi:hypothetical protein
MDTLSMGNPIYEFAAIFSAYKGYSCGDESIRGKFLGITAEQSEQFLVSTLKYYFEGKSEEEIAEIRLKAAIISYTRIYRWMLRRNEKRGEDTLKEAQFCKSFLIENVPKVENLYF